MYRLCLHMCIFNYMYMFMDEDECLFLWRTKVMDIPDTELRVLCSPDIGNWTPTLGSL